MNPIRATRRALLGVLFSCVLVVPALAVTEAPDDSINWSKGRGWVTLRAGYAKSSFGGSAAGNVGGGFGFSHFLSNKWAIGGYVHEDLLGKFGGSAEIEIPMTLEIVRHGRWGAALHPYVGLGGGAFWRKYYRTGDDLTKVHGAAYLTLGANTPLGRGRVFGIDLRAARLPKMEDNPVFRRYAGPFPAVAPAPGTQPLELTGTNLHWSAKLGYSFTY